MNWTLLDFIVAGCLLFGMAMAYLLLAKRFSSPKQRLWLAILLLVLLGYVWAELAVGIFTHLGS